MYENLVEDNLEVYNRFEGSRRRYRIDCPFCESNGKSTPDTKGKMSIFVDSWFCKCHRCGATPHVTHVLIEYGITDFPKKSSQETLKSKLAKLQVSPEKVKDPSPIALPDGCILIRTKHEEEKWFRRARATLRKWGVETRTCHALGWRWNTREDAFYFPSIMGGKIVYYQKRTVDGFRGGASLDVNPYGILYNWESPLRNLVDTVFVVEGPKDAAIAHQNGLWAVSLHGHNLTPQQEERLRSLDHEVIFVLDSDVFHTSQTIEKSGFRVAYLPSKDPAEFRESLKNTILKESFGIKAKVTQLLKNKQTKSNVIKKGRTSSSRF